MSDFQTQTLSDFAGRFPGIDPVAIGASLKDVKGLIDHLAASHDLTLAEAAEAIEDWQAGLAQPS